MHLPRRQHEAAVQARRVEGERLVRGKPEAWGWRKLGLSAGDYRARLRCYQLFLGDHASLDAVQEGETRLWNVLRSEKESSPELQTLLQMLLRRLPKQQAWVLRGYFGLDHTKRRSLRELGQRAGLSEEQVRQILRETLECLRQSLQEER